MSIEPPPVIIINNELLTSDSHSEVVIIMYAPSQTAWTKAFPCQYTDNERSVQIPLLVYFTIPSSITVYYITKSRLHGLEVYYQLYHRKKYFCTPIECSKLT